MTKSRNEYNALIKNRTEDLCKILGRKESTELYDNLFNLIDSFHTMVLSGQEAPSEELRQENAKLKEKLKSIKKEIDTGVSSAWDGINDLENITCSID